MDFPSDVWSCLFNLFAPEFMWIILSCVSKDFYANTRNYIRAVSKPDYSRLFACGYIFNNFTKDVITWNAKLLRYVLPMKYGKIRCLKIEKEHSISILNELGNLYMWKMFPNYFYQKKKHTSKIIGKLEASGEMLLLHVGLISKEDMASMEKITMDSYSVRAYDNANLINQIIHLFEDVYDIPITNMDTKFWYNEKIDLKKKKTDTTSLISIGPYRPLKITNIVADGHFGKSVDIRKIQAIKNDDPSGFTFERNAVMGQFDVIHLKDNIIIDNKIYRLNIMIFSSGYYAVTALRSIEMVETYGKKIEDFLRRIQ